MTKGGEQGAFRGRERHGRRHGITHIMACTGRCGGCGVAWAGGHAGKEPGRRGRGSQGAGEEGEDALHHHRAPGASGRSDSGRGGPKPQDSSTAQLALVTSCHRRRGFSPGLRTPQGRGPTGEPPRWPQAAASGRVSSHCQLTWPRFPAAARLLGSPPTHPPPDPGTRGHSRCRRPLPGRTGGWSCLCQGA